MVLPDSYANCSRPFDLTGYDLVLSSSHIAALGAITGPDQLHVAYMRSPVRFVWDLQPQYLDSFGYGRGVRTLLARATFHYLRMWVAQRRLELIDSWRTPHRCKANTKSVSTGGGCPLSARQYKAILARFCQR